MQNTIITACGSGKYRPLIHGITDALKKSGFIVLPPPLHDMPGLTVGMNPELTLLAWKGATFAHFARIQKANICLMINPDGYLGYSSSLELGYAVSLGKLVIALEHDRAEPAREGLFDIVLEAVDVDVVVEKISTLLLDKKESGL
jgi:hypothetical protein